VFAFLQSRIPRAWRKEMNSTINKALVVAGGVALAVFLLNRFTAGGLASFGKPTPTK
jgi:hypothetical protein